MLRKICKLFLLVIFTLVLLGFQSLAARTPYQDEYTEDFTFPAGGSFEITNISGTVKITGWDEERVSIKAVKTAIKAENREQAEKMLERVKIEVLRRGRAE